MECIVSRTKLLNASHSVKANWRDTEALMNGAGPRDASCWVRERGGARLRVVQSTPGSDCGSGRASLPLDQKVLRLWPEAEPSIYCTHSTTPPEDFWDTPAFFFQAGVRTLPSCGSCGPLPGLGSILISFEPRVSLVFSLGWAPSEAVCAIDPGLVLFVCFVFLSLQVTAGSLDFLPPLVTDKGAFFQGRQHHKELSPN